MKKPEIIEEIINMCNKFGAICIDTRKALSKPIKFKWHTNFEKLPLLNKAMLTDVLKWLQAIDKNEYKILKRVWDYQEPERWHNLTLLYPDELFDEQIQLQKAAKAFERAMNNSRHPIFVKSKFERIIKNVAKQNKTK